MRERNPTLMYAARVAGALALLEAPWQQVRQLAGMLRERLAFPMDLEWMEGAHLYHAHRLLHGLPLYGDPARGFATFPYPPLYWALLAAAGKIFGLDYGVARALSLACVLGAFVLLAVAIVRHAPTVGSGLALAASALGGVAAAYPLTGSAFDLARSDAMALFFPVLAASLLGGGGGDGRAALRGWRIAAVAFALTCAVYTKQTNVFYVAWLLAFAWLRDRRAGLRLAASTVALSAAVLAGLLAATRGWFWVWLFDQGLHGFRPFAEWGQALTEFVRHGPLLVGLPWAIVMLRRRGLLGADTVKWLGMLAAAFVASMLPYAKNGGWFNVLLPFYVLSWPVTFILVGDVARARVTLRGAPAFALAASAIAAANLVYEPAPYVPSAARAEGSRRLHALVHDLPGGAVVTTSPFLAVLEGKTNPQPAYQGYIDAELAGMSMDYAAALDLSGADWLVVVAKPGPHDYRAALAAKFERVRDVDFAFDPLPWPPAQIWRRRSAPP